MPATIPTREPTSIRAGDSLEWDKYLTDYPPSNGWSLEYVLVAGTTRFTVPSSGADDHFEVRLPGAASEHLGPGLYRLVGRVSNSDGDRYTVHESSVTVEPDPILGETSHAEKMVALLEAQLEELELGLQSWQQGDRAETQREIANVRAALNHYREEVRIQRGGSPFTPVVVHFRAP